MTGSIQKRQSIKTITGGKTVITRRKEGVPTEVHRSSGQSFAQYKKHHFLCSAASHTVANSSYRSRTSCATAGLLMVDSASWGTKLYPEQLHRQLRHMYSSDEDQSLGYTIIISDFHMEAWEKK